LTTRILLAWATLQAVLGTFVALPAAAEPLALLGGEFRPDQPFPDSCRSGARGGACGTSMATLIRYATPDMPLGGYLHAFIRNTSASPLEIEDVSINGISLARAIAPEGPVRDADDRFASSIAFSKLAAEPMESLQRMASRSGGRWIRSRFPRVASRRS